MSKEIVKPEGVAVAGIFTPAIKVKGTLVFCSGIVPVDGDGKTVGVGDAAEQTRQILRTLGKTLKAAGADYSDVVALRIFSTDMGNRSAINAARLEFFEEPLPTSTHVEISRLVMPEWLVEIEAIAALD